MIDHKVFFDCVRYAPFHGLNASQVAGMEDLLLRLPDTFRPDWSSYCFATTYHETAHTMQPIEEYGKGRGHPYGRVTGPWGQIYYGRGDVQETWEGNYVFATKRLRELGVIDESMDLDRNPELALRPDIAAAIMYHGMAEGWFTKHKLGDFFSPSRCDPVEARTIINGHDQASTIAGYFQQFYTAFTRATIISDVPVARISTVTPISSPHAPPIPNAAPGAPAVLVPSSVPAGAPPEPSLPHHASVVELLESLLARFVQRKS